jgi:hypothetical protein
MAYLAREALFAAIIHYFDDPYFRTDMIAAILAF